MKAEPSAQAHEGYDDSGTTFVRRTARAFVRRAKPYAIPLALSMLLGYFACSSILERAGRPALPLDDSFIHLQFARRIAEGHPFTFSNGTTGFSSGATSFLWPLLLTPFYLLGMHGLTLVYAAWFLGTVFHAAVIVESKRLTEPLAGKAASYAVAAMCLLFGAFAWFAWSGMETIAFTWSLVRGVRVCADYLERSPAERSRGDVASVIAMGIVSPLIRPEGGIVTLVAAGTLLFASTPIATEHRLAKILGRLPGLVPLVGVAFIPLMNLAFTGHARSTTAMVKWYVGNPYFDVHRLVLAIGGNVKMFVGDLLTGGPYTTIFIPEGTLHLLAPGLVALIAATFRRQTRARALVVFAIVLASFIPCTFSTILWNRVRYIYPFAPGWFALVACLGKELADTVSWLSTLRRRPLYVVALPVIWLISWYALKVAGHAYFPTAAGDGILLDRLFHGIMAATIAVVFVRIAFDVLEKDRATAEHGAFDAAFLAPIVAAAFAGALGTKLTWAVADLATSARAIDHQQVTLGMWAHDNLPADARIGVNDTGAIAYFSDRKTFDVVGLTTEGEARYWVMGAGSRYEHFERMREDELPTHFIVYPQWMAMNAVLGRELTEATVTDQSILGGATKVAYEARYDVLGRGSLPTHLSTNGQLLDEVDVSDLESEEAHRFSVGPSHEGEDQVFMEWDDQGNDVADGGRTNRWMDWFVVRLPPGKRVRMVMRLGADRDVALRIVANDNDIGEVQVPISAWEEREIIVPADVANDQVVVQITPTDPMLRFTSLHYWFYATE